MKQIQAPGALCRVTWNSYLIDWDGYLIPHEMQLHMEDENICEIIPKRDAEVHKPRLMMPTSKMFFPSYRGYPFRVIPLVHPDEWEIMARWFYNKDYFKGSFRLLTIKTPGIEELANEPCPAFIHGEYFGKVHTRHIISDVGYCWKKSDQPVKLSEAAIKFLSGGNVCEIDVLSRSRGYHPIPVQP